MAFELYSFTASDSGPPARSAQFGITEMRVPSLSSVSIYEVKLESPSSNQVTALQGLCQPEARPLWLVQSAHTFSQDDVLEIFREAIP